MHSYAATVVAIALVLAASTADTRAQAGGAADSAREPDAGEARVAFVSVERVAAESVTGKALAGRADALNQQRTGELNEKRKVLQAAQQKLDTGASVMNLAALAQLQKEIERQQIDLERFVEDAQADLQNLQAQLQDEFEATLAPVLQGVALARGLDLLFSMSASGLVWADPSLDVTDEVIRTLDAGTRP